MASLAQGFLALVLVGALVAAGCFSPPAQDDSRPSVVVTLLAYEWLATSIGGDAISVNNIIPIGTSPHEFDPTPHDLAALHDADLVVVNGVELEAWFTQAVKDLPSSVTVFRASNAAAPLVPAGAHTIAVGDGDREQEGPDDPHLRPHRSPPSPRCPGRRNKAPFLKNPSYEGFLYAQRKNMYNRSH